MYMYREKDFEANPKFVHHFKEFVLVCELQVADS